jgi:hypothetical protein
MTPRPFMRALTVHIMAKCPRLAALLCARVFVMRETQTARAVEKYSYVRRETGSVQGKSGVGLLFVRPYLVS